MQSQLSTNHRTTVSANSGSRAEGSQCILLHVRPAQKSPRSKVTFVRLDLVGDIFETSSELRDCACLSLYASVILLEGGVLHPAATPHRLRCGARFRRSGRVRALLSPALKPNVVVLRKGSSNDIAWERWE